MHKKNELSPAEMQKVISYVTHVYNDVQSFSAQGADAYHYQAYFTGTATSRGEKVYLLIRVEGISRRGRVKSLTSTYTTAEMRDAEVRKIAAPDVPYRQVTLAGSFQYDLDFDSGSYTTDELCEQDAKIWLSGGGPEGKEVCVIGNWLSGTAREKAIKEFKQQVQQRDEEIRLFKEKWGLK